MWGMWLHPPCCGSKIKDRIRMDWSKWVVMHQTSRCHNILMVQGLKPGQVFFIHRPFKCYTNSFLVWTHDDKNGASERWNSFADAWSCQSKGEKTHILSQNLVPNFLRRQYPVSITNQPVDSVVDFTELPNLPYKYLPFSTHYSAVRRQSSSIIDKYIP